MLLHILLCLFTTVRCTLCPVNTVWVVYDDVCGWWSLCCAERNRTSTGSTFSPYESFRKSSIERPKSGTPDKRDSWNAEDISTALDSFRPVTITISSFFKQVAAFFYAATETGNFNFFNYPEYVCLARLQWKKWVESGRFDAISVQTVSIVNEVKTAR